MVAYWQEYKVADGLLVELSVENLVREQFNRLEEIYPEAYHLLCRMGCYRHQKVPTVPTEGLSCLLWDVPESRRKKVIESLRNRSLVECQQGEYWLHPVILVDATSRLRASEDWETANRKAADFWKNSFERILNIKNVNLAFEAYYHYVAIEDFESSIELIFHNYLTNDFSVDFEETLGALSLRLGLNHELIYIINRVIDKIYNFYYLSELYLLLGMCHYNLGNLRQSMKYQEESKQLAFEYLDNKLFEDKNHLFYRLKRLKIVTLTNNFSCLIDLGEVEIKLGEVEIQKLSQNLEECLLTTELLISESEETFLSLHLFLCSALAVLKALTGFKEDAYYLAKRAEVEILSIRERSWDKKCKLLHLGMAYKFLGEIDKSFEMYDKLISCLNDNPHERFKGKALTGLAELYRLQLDFETALSHHAESIEILDKLGAKCDLAEAYYQRGLTHQAMGNSSNSLADFQEAIRLYEDMEAPKQVAKVRQAMDNNNQTS